MKRIVLFALVAALCAGALLYFYLGKLEQQKQVQIVYEDVVVAVGDIPAFTQISAEMVQIQKKPAGSSHPFAARTLDQVVGFVTESNIIAGEELLPAKLKQPGQTESGLSYVIPEGMRALTVAVDQVSGVAGFLQRGDYVDVLAYVNVQVVKSTVVDPYEVVTAEDPEGEQMIQEADPSTATTESATLVVAQNICIAAIGTSLADAADAQNGETGYGSVTLFVTPEDALRIVQSARSGSITLALRASGDHEQNTEDPILSGSLLKKAK